MENPILKLDQINELKEMFDTHDDFKISNRKLSDFFKLDSIAKGCETINDVIKKNQYARETPYYNPGLEIETESPYEEWAMWGADKVNIENLEEMCDVFNIDYQEFSARAVLIDELNQDGNTKLWTPLGKSDDSKTRLNYVFYSKDKKLSFTCSDFNFPYDNRIGYASCESVPCYFGYFGVTAELSRAVDTILYFNNNNYSINTDFCWGGRDYI